MANLVNEQDFKHLTNTHGKFLVQTLKNYEETLPTAATLAIFGDSDMLFKVAAQLEFLAFARVYLALREINPEAVAELDRRGLLDFNQATLKWEEGYNGTIDTGEETETD